MDDANPRLAFLMSMAERELGAFMTAVTELYGSEQAKISAGDWLDELESMGGPPELTAHQLRLITIAAAARLANRQIAIGPHTKPIPESRAGTQRTAVHG